MKTFDEIKEAVNAGQRVCWKTNLYEVRHGRAGWFVVCVQNDYTKGLFWADGVTSSYNPDDFFIDE